jgi:hypothetical protein
MTDTLSPNDCNTTTVGEGGGETDETCEDNLDEMRPNVTESSAVDGSRADVDKVVYGDEEGPHLRSDVNDGLTQIVSTEKNFVTIAGRKIHIGFLALVVLILTSVIAGVSVYATTADNKANTLTEDATIDMISSEVEDITNELEKLALPRYNGFNELPPKDKRNYALDWIVHVDPMKLSASDSNLLQRYILALLGLQYELDSNKWLSDKHECLWEGVSCRDGKVNEIDLGEFLICVGTGYFITHSKHTYTHCFRLT